MKTRRRSRDATSSSRRSLRAQNWSSNLILRLPSDRPIYNIAIDRRRKRGNVLAQRFYDFRYPDFYAEDSRARAKLRCRAE